MNEEENEVSELFQSTSEALNTAPKPSITPIITDKMREESAINEYLQAGSEGVMISNEEYHLLPGISGSNLTLLQESNKHLDNKNLFNLEQTEAIILGNLVHCLVLEPDEVFNRFAILPDVDGRTTAGKETINQFKEKSKDKTVISTDFYTKAMKMAKNVFTVHQSIIFDGIKERSLFVEYDKDLILKCRLDIDYDNNDYDVKTISIPGGKKMTVKYLQYHSESMGYHLSAAFRRIVKRSLEMPVNDSYLIFVSSTNGHMVKTIKLSHDYMSFYEDKVYQLINFRKLYLETGLDFPPESFEVNSYE